MTEETEQIKKSYWSVIPASVRYCKKVQDGAKLLYSEITALCNEKGYCWANNEYFASLYGIDHRTVRRWIESLAKEQFIYVVQEKGRRKVFITEKQTGTEAEPASDINAATKKKTTKKAAAPKKEAKEKESKFTTDDMLIAQNLLAKIIENYPTFENKKVKLEEWADDIRKMREIEKATADQIGFMIVWVHGGEVEKNGKKRTFAPHEFWAKNILSAGKLRKQWFNLVPQLQEALKLHVKKTTDLQL